MDHRPQLRGGLVGAVFLDEGGDDRQHDHRADDDGRPDVAEKIGRDRQRRQQGVQRIAGALPDFLDNREPALARDAIGAELLQAAGGLLARQSLGGGVQSREKRVAIEPAVLQQRRVGFDVTRLVGFGAPLAPEKMFIASSARRDRPGSRTHVATCLSQPSIVAYRERLR